MKGAPEAGLSFYNREIGIINKHSVRRRSHKQDSTHKYTLYMPLTVKMSCHVVEGDI